ncbi:hypothetical protein SAMCCGM7_pC1116 (plasmid) [Sinorhizobium americanum CCGM7]|nr:hypothetical protein SAMCCGM7_pC1116 [Sinorhizobium americanum CCGM7]
MVPEVASARVIAHLGSSRRGTRLVMSFKPATCGLVPWQE